MKHGNRDVTIEMSFKPMRKDGVLLYAAQTLEGRGDYIALSLKNGFIEFRYLKCISNVFQLQICLLLGFGAQSRQIIFADDQT
jgi:Laminin G domain